MATTPIKIVRKYVQTLNITIGTSSSGSTAISLMQYAGGRIYIAAGSNLTTLTWYDCDTVDGTYSVAKDGAGNSVTSTVANGQSCPIPPALFGSMFVKAVGNVAATGKASLKG